MSDVTPPLSAASAPRQNRFGAEFFRLRLRWRGVLEAAAVLAVAGTGLSFLGQCHWTLDRFSAFHVQYALLLLAATAVCAAGRQAWRAGSYGAAALVNLALVLPAYFGAIPPAAGRPGHRAVVLNVHTANSNFAAVNEFLRQTDADVVALLEVDQRWWDGLAPTRAAYPHADWHLRTDNFGIALLSRQPLAELKATSLSAAEVLTLSAHVTLGGQALTVIVAHPPPPISGEYAAWRDIELRRLAELAAAAPGPVLLLGDLNTPPWSGHFTRLLRDGQLRDSRRGFGVQPTWPTFIPLLLVPLDHALVSPGVRVRRRWTGPANGSDHYPVALEFALPPAGQR